MLFMGRDMNIDSLKQNSRSPISSIYIRSSEATTKGRWKFQMFYCLIFFFEMDAWLCIKVIHTTTLLKQGIEYQVCRFQSTRQRAW
jgi:hypothetical protein